MRRLVVPALTATLSLALLSCTDDAPSETAPAAGQTSDLSSSNPSSSGHAELHEDFTVVEHATFDEGWAMSFLPGTDLLAVTERGGSLQLYDPDANDARAVDGVPEVYHEGQAGLHDVIPAPSFADDGAVYLSWAREGDTVHGVAARATLDAADAELRDLEIIWEQAPAPGAGHFALRLLVQGEHLFITSGDRQQEDPAQERDTNLGAVVRLTLDGDPAPGNPWFEDGGAAAELWSVGHRNPLGIAEDADGALWVSEMGPQGGDELNLLTEAGNYGWPDASMGVHYDGSPIPDHSEEDGFVAPAEHWVPAISPGSLMIYQGELFEEWRGDAFLGGLSGQRLVRVELEGEAAEAGQEWDAGERIRAVTEGQDGALWVLEDGAGGRLLELRPN
jgi:aldose sugar dehydrogenase